MSLKLRRLITGTTLSIFSVLPLSCSQQNEETGVTGSSIVSALSFQYATSDQVNSSYLLRVEGW